MSKIISYCFAFIIFLSVQTIDVAAVSCSGQKHTATATGYYPGASQGGFNDCKDKPLQTLQQYLAGQVSYVSVAMDENLRITYGTQLCIPELNSKYGRQIEFRVVDTGPAFTGTGYSRLDICTANNQDSYDSAFDHPVTLYFPNLQTGGSVCTV